MRDEPYQGYQQMNEEEEQKFWAEEMERNKELREKQFWDDLTFSLGKAIRNKSDERARGV